MDQGFNTQQKSELTEIVDQVVTSVVGSKLTAELNPIKKDIRKIKMDIKLIVNHFDLRLIDQDKRLIKVERHLGFSQN